MEKPFAIQPLAGVARWLFIMSLIVHFGAARSVYKGQEQIVSVVEKPEAGQCEIHPSLPEERPAVIEEKRPPSRRSAKKEVPFKSVIQQAADRHQVDPALVMAIIMAESGYNPNAVSKRGAMGLMQLMPKTAEELGVKDSFNPAHNINAGVGYFRRLLDRFDGDVELALAAYNAGSGKVRQYQGVPPFKATQCYVKKVFKYYDYYKEQIIEQPDRT